VKKSLFLGKTAVLSVFLLTFLPIFCFISCEEFINWLLTKDINGNSALTIKISVPHYASTHKVKLSIRGNDDEFKIFETLSITEGSIEDVTGAPQIYPGRIQHNRICIRKENQWLYSFV